MKKMKKMKKILIASFVMLGLLTGGYFAYSGIQVDTAKPVVKISSLQKGLVLHLPLDEESYNPATKRLTDKTPYENHGTSANAGNFVADYMGQADRAMSFDGVSDYVDCGNDESLDVTDEITLSVWVKEKSRGIISKVIAKRTGLAFYAIGVYSGIPRIQIGNGISNQVVVAGSTISLDEWHHIVGTFNDATNTGIIYVDGVAKSGTISISIGDTSAANLQIGRYAADYFNGSIADVRIYNRAISQQEITSLYEQYRPKIAMGDLNKGLVLHQPLDKESLQSATSFADKTPYENVGTKYGSVLKFDGTNDYVDCGDIESLNVADIKMTVGAWINTTATAPNNNIGHRIFTTYSFGQTSSRIAFGMKVDKLFVFTGGVLDGSITINDGVWHFVATTYDGTTLKLFVDGVEDVSSVISVSDVFSLSSDLIGMHGVDFFNGSIGDTRIYSRALSSTEITTLYQGGAVDDTDLEAYYKFGDKSGTTLTDETANNNDGTLTNFVSTTAGYGNTHDSGWNTNDTPNVFALDYMGQADRAMSFDGVSDYVDCGANEVFENIKEEITVSAWIKSDGFNPNFNWIVGNNLVVGVTEDLLYWYQNQLCFAINHYALNTARISYIPTGNWDFVVGTYSKSEGKIKIYLNGVKGTDDAYSEDVIWGAGNPLAIGSSKATDVRYPFNGSMSDVRIYNRAISEQEITSLYEQYRPKLSAGSLQKGLVLDMPLKSKYVKTGKELIVNGDFSDTTYTDSSVHELVGWSDNGTHDATNKVTLVGGEARFISDGSACFISQDILTVGKRYIATVNVTNIVSGASRFQNGALLDVWEAGINKWEFTATSVTLQIWRSTTPMDVYFDDVSVKEVLLTDRTPQSNDGQNYGATVGADGTSFNGVDDYVDCGNDESLDVGTEDFTVSFWINLPVDSPYNVLLNKRGGASWFDPLTHGFEFLQTGANHIQLFMSDGSVYKGFYVPITNNKWQHAVFSFDRDGNCSGYVNGVLRSTLDISGATGSLTNTKHLTLMARPGTNAEGSMSDVRIYNRAISQQEITSLYNKGR